MPPAYPYTDICCPQAPAPEVIHCIGHWQGVNSPIKGHSRRGMKKIRKQHRDYGHIGITNEYNTSKTCPFCFSRVVLHRARRIVDGKKLVVRLNGAIECVHPRCPARRLNTPPEEEIRMRPQISLCLEHQSFSHRTASLFLLFQSHKVQPCK